MIGDLRINYYIKDVIVGPSYQSKGIGRLLINEFFNFTNYNGMK